MPTVLKSGRFRFFFFSNEGNEPPHIHVESGDGYAKIWLKEVRIAYRVNLNQKDINKLLKFVIQKRELFIDSWNEHFDKK